MFQTNYSTFIYRKPETITNKFSIHSCFLFKISFNLFLAQRTIIETGHRFGWLGVSFSNLILILICVILGSRRNQRSTFPWHCWIVFVRFVKRQGIFTKSPIPKIRKSNVIVNYSINVPLLNYYCLSIYQMSFCFPLPITIFVF